MSVHKSMQPSILRTGSYFKAASQGCAPPQAVFSTRVDKWAREQLVAMIRAD